VFVAGHRVGRAAPHRRTISATDTTSITRA